VRVVGPRLYIDPPTKACASRLRTQRRFGCIRKKRATRGGCPGSILERVLAVGLALESGGGHEPVVDRGAADLLSAINNDAVLGGGARSPDPPDQVSSAGSGRPAHVSQA
jgi:hypothetical protein